MIPYRGKIGKLCPAYSLGNKRPEDLTDSEWLDQWCSHIRNKLANVKAFDTSAILYRKCYKHFALLRSSAGPVIRRAKLEKAGDELTRLMEQAATVKHPKDWVICYACRGKCVNPQSETEKCRACYGDGFTLTFRTL